MISAAPDPLPLARAYFQGAGASAWLVGGRIRDALLDRETRDTDVLVAEGAVRHGKALAAATGGSYVAIAPERGMVRVVWKGDGPGAHAELDLSDFAGASLEADLAARDFAVNALALPLMAPWPPRREDIVDPTGGLADLAAGRIRATSTAVLDADPLRLLRGPRIARTHGLTIEPATRAAIRARAHLLRQPAAERIRDELLRLLAAPDAAAGLRELDALGLLAVLLPELDAEAKARGQAARDGGADLDARLTRLRRWERLEAALRGAPAADGPFAALAPWADPLRGFLAQPGGDGWPRALMLRWASLWLRPAPRGPDARHAPVMAGAELLQAAERRAEELRFARAEQERLARILRHQDAPLSLVARGRPPSPRAMHRYYRPLGEAGLDVALLATAAPDDPAARAAVVEVAAGLARAWLDEHDRVVAPTPPLDGRALMEGLGLPPGPRIGRLHRALAEETAAGTFAGATDPVAAALAWARAWLATDDGIPGGRTGGAGEREKDGSGEEAGPAGHAARR